MTDFFNNLAIGMKFVRQGKLDNGSTGRPNILWKSTSSRAADDKGLIYIIPLNERVIPIKFAQKPPKN